MNANFKGIYPVVLTIFKDNGDIDYDSVKKHVDYLIESKVHGLCLMGATGEYLSVSDEEYGEYIQLMIDYVNNRVPVVVGATRERTEDVVKLIKQAKRSGAKAAMVLPPYYSHPSQLEIFQHFKFITENTDLPIIIYNNPGSAGVNIERETYDKLLQELKNIVMIKESTGDIKELTYLLIKNLKDVSIFCGCDNMSFESLLVGAAGWISMLGNIAPKNCVKLFELIEQGSVEKALELYKNLLPALDILENYGKPVQTLKYILNRKDMQGGYVRRPRMELSGEDKKYIDERIDLNFMY